MALSGTEQRGNKMKKITNWIWIAFLKRVKKSKTISSSTVIRINDLIDKGVAPLDINKEMWHLKLSTIEKMAEKRDRTKYSL